MTTSEAAKIIGVDLYQEFILKGHCGVLRFTESILELKIGKGWGPAYIQDLLIKAIIDKVKKDNGFLITL